VESLARAGILRPEFAASHHADVAGAALCRLLRRVHGFVFNRAGESVVATMAAHLSLNIMHGLGGAALTSPMFWGVQAAVFGVAAVVITIASRTHRQRVPSLIDGIGVVKIAS
jgi:hypothetical protein